MPDTAARAEVMTPSGTPPSSSPASWPHLGRRALAGLLLALLGTCAAAQEAPAAGESGPGSGAPAAAAETEAPDDTAPTRIQRQITPEERLRTELPLLPEDRAARKFTGPVELSDFPVDALIGMLGQKDFLDVNIVLATGANLDTPVNLYVADMTLGEIFDLVLQLNDLKALRFNENTLIIVDKGDNRTFGVQQEKIYRLTYTTPEAVLEFVAENPNLSEILLPDNYIPDLRNNALLALDTPDNLKLMDHVVRLLDAETRKVAVRIPLSHIELQDLQTAITSLPQEIQQRINIDEAVYSEDGRTVIIYETPEDVELLRDLVRQIDIGRKQALIDAAVMEVTETVARDLGLQLFDSSFRVESIDKLWNLDRLRADLAANQVSTSATGLSYLLQRQGGNTIANPKVRVIDRESASINVGQIRNVRVQTAQFASNQLQTTQQTTFNTQEVPIGVTLTVTPEIHNDGTLTLELDISDEAIITINDFGVDRTTRNTQSQLRVRDGETVILGGFINRQISYDKTPIPIFGKLPLIKNLFRRNQRQKIGSELVILMTPYILDYDPVVPKAEVSLMPKGKSLRHLGKDQERDRAGFSAETVKPKSKTTITRWIETEDTRTKVIYDAQGDVIYRRSWPRSEGQEGADAGSEAGGSVWEEASAAGGADTGSSSGPPEAAPEAPVDDGVQGDSEMAGTGEGLDDLYSEPLSPPDLAPDAPGAEGGGSDGGTDAEWSGLIDDLNGLVGG